MLRSLFKQSSVYFIALIGGKALTTLAWIIFARLFTQEFTGGIIFFVTLIEITTFIADFGLNQWYMKHADDGESTFRNTLKEKRKRT
jgi:O-antigen/teichoic acid export membrane protein